MDLRSLYLRYNRCCNAHEFDRLGEFVAERVQIDGETRALAQYQANLRGWTDAFPDFRWEVRHLVVEGDWLAARFHDTGTHHGAFQGIPPTGRTVSTHEFAMYRFADGRITEVWGTVGDLLGQLR